MGRGWTGWHICVAGAATDSGPKNMAIEETDSNGRYMDMGEVRL